MRWSGCSCRKPFGRRGRRWFLPFKLTWNANILDYGEPALICKQHNLPDSAVEMLAA